MEKIFLGTYYKCKNCGKVFLITNLTDYSWKIDKNKYCSWSCYLTAAREKGLTKTNENVTQQLANMKKNNEAELEEKKRRMKLLLKKSEQRKILNEKKKRITR